MFNVYQESHIRFQGIKYRNIRVCILTMTNDYCDEDVKSGICYQTVFLVGFTFSESLYLSVRNCPNGYAVQSYSHFCTLTCSSIHGVGLVMTALKLHYHNRVSGFPFKKKKPDTSDDINAIVRTQNWTHGEGKLQLPATIGPTTLFC